MMMDNETSMVIVPTALISGAIQRYRVGRIYMGRVLSGVNGGAKLVHSKCHVAPLGAVEETAATYETILDAE